MKTKEAYRPSHEYQASNGWIIDRNGFPIENAHYFGDDDNLARLLNEAYERGYRDGQTKGK